MGADDTDDDRDWLARKIVALRIFDDAAAVMNRSVVDDRRRDPRGQPVHAVRLDKERQPAVVVGSGAASDRGAEIRRLRSALARELGKPVQAGVFGAAMQVALVNDGPVTIWLDSRQRE